MSYDVHFQPTDGEGLKPITFGYRAAVAVSGFQRLINRWMKCMLTPKGTDPMSPTEGTQFTTLIGGNVGDAQTVLDHVTVCMQDAAEQMRNWDRVRSAPSDERFADARVEKLVDLGDRFDVWVRIRNAAGSTTTITLPSSGLR